MCGRYYIEIGDEELREIAGEIEKNRQNFPGQMTIKTNGDIFPTDIVPVRTGPQQYLPMRWGFTGPGGNPVINARSETAAQKPMFRQATAENRCLIPASGYYEWQICKGEKIRYRFRLPGSAMYLAGCYRKEQPGSVFNFVILTKKAQEDIEDIHKRMPAIIPRKSAEEWLNGGMPALMSLYGCLITLDFEPVPEKQYAL
ncbi:MAG: SOS response-associated peptidase [Oscillospiraceae bacterium]|nr:SOS response-associated peptidase [Oscillospiraceae bacterium]